MSLLRPAVIKQHKPNPTLQQNNYKDIDYNIIFKDRTHKKVSLIV